ncbi:MAG: hypothetical protein V1850_00315 [Candidatus Bathyarchaeota archaeon]
MRAFVDYDKASYCAACELRLPLDTLRCPECGHNVRHNPINLRKRVEKK